MTSFQITSSAQLNSQHHLTASKRNSQAAPCSCEKRSRCQSNVSYEVTSPAPGGRIIGPQEKFAEFRSQPTWSNPIVCRSPSLHPQQKPPSAVTKTSLSSRPHHSSARNSPTKSVPSAWKSTAAPPPMPSRAGSSSPTRNSNLACSTTN